VVYIQGMPRLREVSRDQADPFVRQIYQVLFGERDPVREPGTETGSPGNWWTVFALSPDCFRPDVFTPVERAVLAYTDCLVLDGGRTPDGVFAALKSHLSDEEILELTYVTTLYEMHASMCRALRLEYDDVDERVTEVAAPTEAAMDVMRMVDS
jgi:hypothetical protein